MRPRLRRSTAGTAEKETAAGGRRVDLSMIDDDEKAWHREVAKRIVRARKEAGLTQVELAELIGSSARSMQGYENAEVFPHRKMVDLARVLNKPIEWLLHGDDAILPSEQKLEVIAREIENLKGMLGTVLSKLE